MASQGKAQRLFPFIVGLLVVWPVSGAMCQVHIHEHVVILPAERFHGSAVHNLRFVFAWDTHSMSRLYVPIAPCDAGPSDNPRYGSDSIVVDVPGGYSGQYAFDPQVGIGFVPNGETIHAKFSIYIDTNIVYQRSAALVGSGDGVYAVWPSGWIYYTPPWNSGFNFNLDPKSIPYLTDSHPTISGINDCSGGSWMPADSVTLTIISGTEYASFYGYDISNGTYDIEFGSEVKGTPADITGNILLSAQRAVPGSQGEWVVVQASSDGMGKIDSVLVTAPPELDHFTVQLEPDTIAYSEASKIIVQAKDADNQDFFLGGDILISAEPGGYGEMTYEIPGRAGDIKPKTPVHAVQSLGSTHRVSDDGIDVPYFAANYGYVSFISDGTKPADEVAITFTVTSVDEPAKKGTGNLVIKGSEPELVVIYPMDEQLDRKDITAEPKMPEITAKAKLENYSGGTVNFQWNLRIQYQGEDGRQFDDEFPGNTTAENSDVSLWHIDWQKMISGGDEITLDVTATAGGKVYDKTVNHPFKVVGINPTKDQIKSGMSIEEQVIAYMESKPRWHHFKKDHDFPIWGRQHGYGLMQLDNPRATDEQVWNWVENRKEGQRRFAGKKELATAHPETVRNWGGKYRYALEYTQEEELTDAFQLYNGYHYWIWAPIVKTVPSLGGHWIKDPNLGKPKAEGGYGRDYGGPAMQVYDDVVNGNPPAAW
ncbi:MAG TPA: hypothetical protein VIS48_16190 [Candidatus Kryptonia bacterium]